MESNFLDVPQTPSSTSIGPVALPILYRDASWMGVFYRVSLDIAQRLIAHPDVEPWPVMGAALAAIYAWEYRDSTVGSYNEVGLGIQCRLKGRKPSLVTLVRDMAAQPEQGIWVLSLPVTTQAALVAGREIWGYPKYVTDIRTHFDPQGGRVTLGNELELEVRNARGPKVPLPIVTYTALDGALLRTGISVEHSVRTGLGFQARVRITGSGPTADLARELGFNRKSPIASFRGEPFRAQLPAGVVLR